MADLSDIDWDKVHWPDDALADFPGLMAKLADKAAGPELLRRLVDEWDSLAADVSYSFAPNEDDDVTRPYTPEPIGLLTSALVAWCDNIHRGGIDPLPLIRASIVANRDLKPADAADWKAAAAEAAITTARIRLWITCNDATAPKAVPADIDFEPPVLVTYAELGKLAHPRIAKKTIHNLLKGHAGRGQIDYRKALEIWPSLRTKSLLPLSVVKARQAVEALRHKT
jgi:hypothetical protein